MVLTIYGRNAYVFSVDNDYLMKRIQSMRMDVCK